MTGRQHLPNRRRQRTRELVFNGQKFYLSVGIDPATNNLLEIFIEGAPQADAEVDARPGPRVGTALHTILQDLAVVVSLALQNSVRPADLAKSLARIPAIGQGLFAPAKEPASVVGALLDLVVVVEDEYGQEPENGEAA